MKEHRFIGMDTGASVYSAKVFCEYCGLIAYDANRRDLTETGQREAKEPCPRAIKEVECQHQYHFFGDQVTQRRCVKCNRLEVE